MDDMNTGMEEEKKDGMPMEGDKPEADNATPEGGAMPAEGGEEKKDEENKGW